MKTFTFCAALTAFASASELGQLDNDSTELILAEVNLELLAQVNAAVEAEAECPYYGCGGCGCYNHCGCCDCSCSCDDSDTTVVTDPGSWNPNDCYDDTNCFTFTLADCPDVSGLNDSASGTFDIFDVNRTQGHEKCMNVCEFAFMRECLTTLVYPQW